MAESSLEPKQQEPKENADMISDLPDSLLHHILSFVPTKTSVATSILSHRWLNLWKDLQVFDFTDDSHEFYDDTGELFKRFVVFVNNVLSLRETRDVHRFRLACGHSHPDPFHADLVATWIDDVIGPHLKELHLTLFSNDGHGFVVPRRLFDECKNLEALILCGGIHIHPQQPSSVKFSSLKKLYLEIDSIESVNVLLNGCPILETLILSFAPKEIVKVRVPSTLKKLEFTVENDVETELEIHAPSLEYLSITQCASARHFNCTIVGNLNNVVKAYLDVHAMEEPIDALLRLLTTICRTKFLALRRLTTTWLLCWPIPNFPDFSYLLHLELTVRWFNSSFLVKLLQKCHTLRYLKLQIEQNPPIHTRHWVLPTIVPNCLASHLNTIHLIGYQGNPDELAFVGYIIQKTLASSKVIIQCDARIGIQRKHQILMELFIIARNFRRDQTNLYILN